MGSSARKLWDVLANALGKRRSPLFLVITTAGSGEESLCRTQHNYCERVLSQVHEDDSQFAWVCGLVSTVTITSTSQPGSRRKPEPRRRASTSKSCARQSTKPRVILHPSTASFGSVSASGLRLTRPSSRWRSGRSAVNQWISTHYTVNPATAVWIFSTTRPTSKRIRAFSFPPYKDPC